MSEDDDYYNRVKRYFDPNSLFNICKDLLLTYDVSLIDRLPKGLIDAFKANAYGDIDVEKCSKDRPVLKKLIHNYYNKHTLPPRPIAKFISGPKNLTVHWNSFYRKLIYVFGEAHVASPDCSQKFPHSNSTDIMSIEEYIRQLYEHSHVFIDLFAEFPAIKKKIFEYAPDITNFKPFNPLNYTLYGLFETVKHCVNPNTRNFEACQLGRVHFFDVRTYNPAVSQHTTLMSHFFMDFYRSTTDQDINKVLVDWKKTLVYIQGCFSPTDLDKATAFFSVYILSNPYNVEELKTLVNTEDGNNLRSILEDFIREEIRNLIISADAKNIKENINLLAQYKSTSFESKKVLPIGVRESFEIFKQFLTSEVAITADVYMLSRMFKKFNLTKLGFKGAIQGDQPDEARNIIIYGGDQHAQRCRRFLNLLDFEEIGKTGQSEPTNGYDSCIDMKHISQPFFTIESTEENKYKNDYQFNYDNRYFGNQPWDPMDTRY